MIEGVNMNSDNHERFSFLEEMQDVRPLRTEERVLSTKNETSLKHQLKREAIEKKVALDKNGLSIEHVIPLDPYDFLSFKQDGVQEGVFKNLRLGKYHIDSRLSLQRMRLDDARVLLYETITDCHSRGIRTLLIDHGLGVNSKPFPAFMKSYVNQWLMELEPVIAFHTALKQHGGLSSVYVLLKKHPNQKQINRERHQQR